jgi:hypothetical protein
MGVVQMSTSPQAHQMVDYQLARVWTCLRTKPIRKFVLRDISFGFYLILKLEHLFDDLDNPRTGILLQVF